MILEIKITRTSNGLKLSQEHYVEKILRKFEHFDCKPVSTPYDLAHSWRKIKNIGLPKLSMPKLLGA